MPAYGAPLFRNRPNYGWSELGVSDRIELVRGLHPNLTDFRRLIWIESPTDGLPPGAANQAEFATREGLPSTSGQTIYVNAHPKEAENKWGWVRKHNDWTYPDDSPVKNPTGLFAERFDGSDHGYGVQNNGIGIPSMFAPGTLDILLMGARKAFEVGFSAMFLDSTTTPRLQGLDFSPWAQAAFREHLAELSEDRLDDLGVTDPESLDVRDELRNRGVTPREETHPATEPLYREYLLFQHQGLQALLTTYKDRLDAAFPDRDPWTTLLYGNQFVGESVGNAPGAALHVSEVLDFVNIEDNRTLPPDVIREPVYKLLLATGKEEKPVLFEGQMHDQPGSAQTLRGLDPTERYPSLQRLQLAEAFANGVPRKLPLTSWGNIHADDTVTHWVQKDGTIPDPLQSFADFLWTNERFLREASPDNDVAVVCSIPTLLWERAPQWDHTLDRHLDSFRGICALLRDAQIPYDVTIFGHDRLYDDATHLDALPDYDAVVLPGITSIADRQQDALESVVDAGGTVVTSATIPDRDHYYKPRSSEWFEGNSVTNLSDHPGLTRTREGRTAGSLTAALDGVGGVTIDGPDTVGVNRLQTDDPETVQIHLVNYDYDKESDTVETARDVTLTVSNDVLGSDPATATYVTPDGRVNVEVQQTDGSIILTIPQLDEWGFVVFAADAQALSPPGDESVARTKISTLETYLEGAKNDLPSLSSDPTFVRARVFLREALVAMDAHVYDKAIDRAEAGLAAVSSLPVSLTETHTERPPDPKTQTQTEHPGPPKTRTQSEPSPTATELDDQSQTTGATGPGFGLGSSIVGLSAGLALTVRRLIRDDER